MGFGDWLSSGLGLSEATAANGGTFWDNLGGSSWMHDNAATVNGGTIGNYDRGVFGDGLGSVFGQSTQGNVVGSNSSGLLGGLAGLSKNYGSGNVLQDLTSLGGLYAQYQGMENAADQAEWVRNQYDAREKERKKKQGLAQASMTNSFNSVYG
jgi:hypothetical protein